MTSVYEFNTVTFGLPTETFRVKAYVALEERLPIVTEFVLRLLRICRHMPLSGLRSYFGFSDAEALAVVESLSRQGLIELFDDQVQLSQFATERFDQSGGDHPGFTKVKMRQDTVTFDLISFAPLRLRASRKLGNGRELEADEAVLSESVERARSAYRARFAEVASMREELRERSYGVYAVEDVESKGRGYLPLAVSFALDDDGQVHRRLEEGFERIAPPELANFVQERVTASIPKTLSVGLAGIEEFIDVFDVNVMHQFVIGKKFDLIGYLRSVHSERAVTYPRGMDAMLGSIYLEANLERVVSRLRIRREGRTRQGRLLTSAAWLTPDYELWGRGAAYARAVETLSAELSTEKSADALHIFAYAERGDESRRSAQLWAPRLRELHFARASGVDGMLMSGRLEILLYPTAFVVALVHVAIPGNAGLWAPIGFLSTLPKHLETAHKLLRSTLTAGGYGGKARLGRSEGGDSQITFEQACPFLHFEAVRRAADTDLDDSE